MIEASDSAAAPRTSCARDGPRPATPRSATATGRSRAASLIATAGTRRARPSRARRAPAGGRSPPSSRRRRRRAGAGARSRVAKMKSQAKASGHWSRSWTPIVGGCGLRRDAGNCQASSKAGTRASSNGAVMRACSGSSGRKLKSPVRIAETVCGWAWNGSPESLRARSSRACPHASAWRARSASTCAARCALRVVLEVRRHHAQRPERRLRRRASSSIRGMLRTAGSAGHGSCTRSTCATGRRLRIMLPKRAARAVGPATSTGVRGDRREAGQQRGEERELVFARAALQRREVGGDLLQAEDVEVGERARVDRRSAAGRRGRRSRGTTGCSR